MYIYYMYLSLSIYIYIYIHTIYSICPPLSEAVIKWIEAGNIGPSAHSVQEYDKRPLIS